ncbi:MAG TPA: PIN domain-containing protein [Bryobacteraceae bacterium]
MNVLVDTSVWSLAFRRKPKHLNARERRLVGELADLVREGRARIIGLVRQEVLSGIKTHAQLEKLRRTLAAFSDIPIDTRDYEVAAEGSNACLA